MSGSFWFDRDMNNGFNSYWTFFKGKKLNRAEKVVKSFMKRLEARYEMISFFPKPVMRMERLKKVLTKVSVDVLEGLTRCCVLTNNFVPIKQIVVGDWKNDFSYARRFALWRGATFKGLHPYGKEFVEEALNQSEPVAENLWQMHKQMNEKRLSVTSIYEASIKESFADSQKTTLWNSNKVSAQAFRKQVFADCPDLEQLYNNSKSQNKVVGHHKNFAPISTMRQKCL